jgi:hypothetical protein
MSTHFDYVIYVDIDHHSLGRQILTWVFGSTLRIVLYVDINDVVKMCRHRARWSMSTLRPKPFSVDIERNLRVDLLNFYLNNSTRLKLAIDDNCLDIFNFEVKVFEKHLRDLIDGDMIALVLIGQTELIPFR